MQTRDAFSPSLRSGLSTVTLNRDPIFFWKHCMMRKLAPVVRSQAWRWWIRRPKNGMGSPSSIFQPWRLVVSSCPRHDWTFPALEYSTVAHALPNSNILFRNGIPLGHLLRTLCCCWENYVWPNAREIRFPIESIVCNPLLIRYFSSSQNLTYWSVTKHVAQFRTLRSQDPDLAIKNRWCM